MIFLCPHVSINNICFTYLFFSLFISHVHRFLVFENFYYVASGIGVMPKGHAPNAVFDRSKFPVVTSPSEMLG